VAPQQAPLLVAEIGASVQGAAVVPHNKIADAPMVRVNELILLDVLEELVQQRPALRVVHALDSPGHQPIDVQRLAPGVGVRANELL
jgi:hypothetical protein